MSEPETSNETSVFEKIIAREIPASIIYEDDDVISFLDINPINKGHALIVPKEKSVNIFDTDPEMLEKMIIVVQKVAKALIKATGAEGANLLMNNGEVAGQDVFHAHMHVVPRFQKDEAFKPAQHVRYEEEEMNTLAEKIQSEL